MKRLLGFGVVLLVVLSPVDVRAEVSDKIPSLVRLWIEGLALAVLAVFLVRRRLWLGLIPVALSAILLFDTWDMFRDPSVAEAVRSEQGASYIVSAWVAPALSFLVVGLAALRELIVRHRTSSGIDA